MPEITFVVYKHCLSSTITALIDAFSICNSLCDDTKMKKSQTPSLFFDMKIAGVSKEPVLTNGGVWIQPDAAFASVKNSDLIIIPPRLFAKLPNDTELSSIIPWLKKNYRKGVRIGTLCTGSFVLALTGLLDKKIATTNWLFAKKFQRQFPMLNNEIN